MTQDFKDLLLKDLNARLPYGVKVGTLDNDGSLENIWEVLWNNTFTEDIKLINSIEDADKIIDVSEIRPYLFPLSSMTSKQRTEIGKILTDTQKQYSPYGVVNTEGCDNLFICSVKQSNALINYCLSQHLDINGLIEQGLAIDATNLNIY